MTTEDTDELFIPGEEAEAPESLSDEELAARQALFQSEFYPHMSSLFRFAIRLVRDEAEAQDLVQDTYLKAFRFAKSYQPGTNAKAWLFRIMRNAFINDLRKKQKGPELGGFDELEDHFNAEDEGGFQKTSDLRTEMFDHMIGDELANALQSLPADFRLILMLCDLEGFSYEELAAIFGIPIGTVRSRLHRARQLMKSKLKAYASKLGYETE